MLKYWSMKHQAVRTLPHTYAFAKRGLFQSLSTRCSDDVVAVAQDSGADSSYPETLVADSATTTVAKTAGLAHA
jgi:hypothetical protein